jgi:hypothetical protein
VKVEELQPLDDAARDQHFDDDRDGRLYEEPALATIAREIDVGHALEGT